VGERTSETEDADDDDDEGIVNWVSSDINDDDEIPDSLFVSSGRSRCKGVGVEDGVAG
jgi:hypothetical protein